MLRYTFVSLQAIRRGLSARVCVTVRLVCTHHIRFCAFSACLCAYRISIDAMSKWNATSIRLDM